MPDLTAEMRAVARELLEQGEVKCVVGWEKGTLWYQSPPAFIFRPEEVERLVWDDFCLANLSQYLLDDRYSNDRVALFVKGCDARGINRLLQDQQLKRERVYLIGVACPGLKDPAAAAGAPPGAAGELPLAPKCRTCTHRTPVVYDRLLGEPVPDAGPEAAARFSRVAELEKAGLDQAYQQWQGVFNRCIRCFACRNVCPACNCTYCCFDLDNPRWLEKEVTAGQSAFYLLTRGFHVAGRCIECGECERVCPMHLPLMDLNRKMIKDIDELFGPYEAGLRLEDRPPLGWYDLQDPDPFK